MNVSEFIQDVIAHYVAYNGQHLLALIIGTYGDNQEEADLFLITNMPNIAGTTNFGTQFHARIPHNEDEHKPGTWHWLKTTDRDEGQVAPQAESEPP